MQSAKKRLFFSASSASPGHCGLVISPLKHAKRASSPCIVPQYSAVSPQSVSLSVRFPESVGLSVLLKVSFCPPSTVCQFFSPSPSISQSFCPYLSVCQSVRLPVSVSLSVLLPVSVSLSVLLPESISLLFLFMCLLPLSLSMNRTGREGHIKEWTSGLR